MTATPAGPGGVRATAEAVPGLPRDDDGPVFAEPWEAQVFVLAVGLSERGLFEWREFTAVLAEEIASAGALPDRAADRRGYYEHWTHALERVLTDRHGVSAVEIDARSERWRRAYRHTPHGEPIELSAAEDTGHEPAPATSGNAADGPAP